MEYVTPPLPAAVLWDMDGTIVDTEPLWMGAEEALVLRHGGTWTHADSLSLVGSDLLEAAAFIRERGGIPMTPEQIVEHMVGEVLKGIADGLTWQPGVFELLTELRELGVPQALVTMSYRRLAEAVVRRLPDGLFGAVVTGDEVTNGKPHPEPYLTAARELGVDPAGSIVIEDSPRGAAAGLAAGALVLSIPNAVAAVPEPGLVVIDSLAGMRAKDLLASFDDSALDSRSTFLS
ncbi:HAD family phosphatase [Jiangella ureilytica]|uniref:HAD family phosphatase n=1 Tax=Jiangella ureilytica TaxID=2530374 RepID=A0A4R4RRR7_9ACTN|nr:HAD family phosphatase [Jiangella ureilytica]TDC52560.1 HAD family phosphatase [Jiangella ureilytica]